MRLGIHAVSAKMGGAATYLQNVVPELVRQIMAAHPGSDVILWHSGLAKPGTTWTSGIDLREVGDSRVRITGANAVSRLWFDQIEMPRLAARERLDSLFATANYCALRARVPQVLLVRNPVYFDRTYLARMPRGVRASMALQRLLTIQSMKVARVVLFPTAAMQRLVGNWTSVDGKKFRVAHYGALPERFFPAPGATSAAATKLLYVSAYSDQKNVGTLLRAIRTLGDDGQTPVSLRLTAGFDKPWLINAPSFPDFASDAALYQQLAARGLASDVSFMAYDSLPDLYRSSDIFVFPSYSESFGHPLVEAMASGLPIVAADTPVNRELCEDAAMYVPPFDSGAFVDAIRDLVSDAVARRRMAQRGRERARLFTWHGHVHTLLSALSEN